MSQTSPKPVKPAFPIAMTVVLSIILTLAAMQVIRGCGADGSVPLITSSSQYNQVLRDVEKLTTEALTKSDEERPLTDEDRANLRKAEPLALGLIAFRKDDFPPYLIAAKIRYAEEEYENAIQACYFLFERAPAQGTMDIIEAVAETRYVCSRANFKLGHYREAIAEALEAKKLITNNPKYYWALASAYGQSGMKKEANQTITDGLAIDWTYQKLLDLKKLYASKADPPKKP